MKAVHIPRKNKSDENPSCDCCPHEHEHESKHNHGHDHGVHVEGDCCAAEGFTARGEQDCDGDGCACCNPSDDWSPKSMIIRLLCAGALLALAVVFENAGWFRYVLFVASYLTAGYDVLWRAIKNIASLRMFDENLLMAVATVGAFAINSPTEGVAVMLFYQTGELFQAMAVHRSRESIADLMDIRPDYARLVTETGSERVSPARVPVGASILVQPGEKIPLDGVVEEGSGTLDTAALTGESLPREVHAGSDVLAGFVNGGSLLRIRVTKPFGESAVAKILELVSGASERKAPAEQFISRFARVYTPIVVGLAVLLALIPPLLTGQAFYGWFYRALVFLVVSCPCALVLSIPLSFFAGLGGASRSGVLVKGGNFLEALNDVETIVFDKTGTLTKGVFKVTSLHPAAGYGESRLLELAAYAEAHSNHPIAQSILGAYGQTADPARLSQYAEKPGFGVSVSLDGKKVLAGSAAWLAEHGIPASTAAQVGTAVHVAEQGVYAGCLVLADEVKDDAAQAIAGLRSRGIRTVMLTGDSEAIARSVAQKLGIDEWRAQLLPHEKVEAVEAIERRSKKGKLAFAGDGINDAPVLARADIGIAMGGLGSDAAIEAADVVLMSDQPSRIISALEIAKKTRVIVVQNIVFALVIKLIVLALSAFGLATMAYAVFADVGVCLLAVLNALRAMRKR